MDVTDVQLMLAVKDGSTEAFAELVSRHHAKVINFFFRNLWDQGQSEDLAQEVFIRVFKAAGSYSPQAKFTTFLYRIAKNLLIDWYRSRASQPMALSLDGRMDQGGNADSSGRLGDHVAARSAAPDSRIQQSELGLRIQAALEQLPLEQRLVFVMSEIEGMKYHDIAEALEIPEGTVKSRMHTAFNRLRELLSDISPDGSGRTRLDAVGSAPPGPGKTMTDDGKAIASSGVQRPPRPGDKPTSGAIHGAVAPPHAVAK